jgi:hypothetical protein
MIFSYALVTPTFGRPMGVAICIYVGAETLWGKKPALLPAYVSYAIYLLCICYTIFVYVLTSPDLALF